VKTTTIVNVHTGDSVSGTYFSIIPPFYIHYRDGEPPDPNSQDIYERPMFTHGEWLSRKESEAR